MFYISHRGNLDGPNKEKENHPDYILKALKSGFHVEIDVWMIDNKFYLGHDDPQYETDLKFIRTPYLWLHAKNIEALAAFVDNWIYNCFWHETDTATLTSQGYIWTYPGKTLASKRAIAVLPETVPDWDLTNAQGICSDYIKDYRK